jgi:Ca-activated chloride channel family protein
VSSGFLAPGRLWLLLVVLALGAGYLTVVKWRRTARMRFTQVDLLDQIVPRRPNWRRHVVAVCMLVGLTMAVVATARPVDRSIERTRSEGRILVLFDVSLSMMATDVDPDRFIAAQAAARDFIDEVDARVEVGLISFSGSVTVEVPPTLDRPRLTDGIDRLQLAPATAIGDALAIATRLLEQAGADAPTGTLDADEDRPPGVIVLLTDGETTVGRPTMEGAQAAQAAGVPVFTISFGTLSGAIEDPGGSGVLIPVPVRPEEMRAVAELTGGEAFEAETSEALVEAYDAIRGSLGDTVGETIEVVTEHTWRWTMGAFLMLTLGWGLSLWWLRGMV